MARPLDPSQSSVWQRVFAVAAAVTIVVAVAVPLVLLVAPLLAPFAVFCAPWVVAFRRPALGRPL